MKTYKIQVDKLENLSGDFETIGTYEGFIYVLADNLESPFEEAQTPEALEQSLHSAKARKLQDLILAYEEFIRGVVVCPQSEVLTWQTQEQEAQAYQKSKQESDAPLLKALSIARNVSLESLASKVLFKASTYRAFIAHAIGQRQALQDAIERAQSFSALDNIHIHFDFKGENNGRD